MSSERVPLPYLATCDSEPITRLDRIQNFGFLVALSKDWSVVRASANLGLHIGIDAASAIGGSFSATVDADAEAAIRSRIARLHSTGNERLFGIRLIADRAPFDLNLHFVDDILVIEGEQSVGNEIQDATPMIRMMMEQLSKAPAPDAFLWAAAGQVREITGFDRVMVYCIGPTGNGEVVADSTGPGIESLVGLHYPGADIPKQAQALYLRNTFRITSDVGALPVALLPSGNALPLDLSQSITRAASPIHIEYLTNMGVSATLSISIIVDGKLWGLFTCHHFAPRLPSFIMRTAADLYGSVFSLALESRLARASVAALDSARARTDVAFARIAANPSLLATSEWLQNMVAEMFDYDGMAIYLGGEAVCQGSTPAAGGVAAIAQYLSLASPGRVFTTDQLTSIGTLSAADLVNAAGMLAIPISHLPGDYIMLFRREHLTSLNWGGDPGKFSSSEDGTRVSPRKSFAAFVETIHGKSRPFLDSDRRTGEAVRGAMVEVILNLSAASMAALAAEVEARRQVEREVFGLNEQFEAKVQERTGELSASNDRLQKKIVVGAAALKSSRAEVGSGLADLLASETALASARVLNNSRLFDLVESETALASARAETELDRADLETSATALASSKAEVKVGVAELLASTLALAASRAEMKISLADLLVSAVDLASSKAETRAGQTLLIDSEDTNKALSLANDVLVVNEATLERLVAQRTGALAAEKESRQEAEEQLRQSQKMEAIGQLTGGIAHDFNNLLTGITGALDIIRRRVASGRTDDIDRFMDGASTSAYRAAALTQRLLAFSRRQLLHTRSCDTNALIAGMDDMLRRSLGEQVRMEIRLGGGLWPALADANQFENAILNLAINARDAMPGGGRLGITTANATVSATDAARRDNELPGSYVAISVTDSGTGMTPDVVAKVFEPFFTTKPIGQGTGLGLSMVYGFVQQSGGHIRIDSEVGHGTTVTLYLPRASVDPAATKAGGPPLSPQGHGETVLVVEDDPTVRLLVVEVLEELGYCHHQAADSAEALTILRSATKIDFMVSDVGLPGMDGRELGGLAQASRPGLKVLLITGYAAKATEQADFLGPDMDILLKPFTLDTLGIKIRSMMNA